MSDGILMLAVQRPEGLTYRRNESLVGCADNNGGKHTHETPVAWKRTHDPDESYDNAEPHYGPFYAQGKE